MNRHFSKEDIQMGNRHIKDAQHNSSSEKYKSKPWWDTTSHLSEWLRLTTQETTVSGGGEERGTLLHCWWECKLEQPLWKTLWNFLKKLKIELLYDPAFVLLGIYLKNTKIQIWRGTCTPVFTTAFSTVAKLWREPKCSLTDERIKKMWHIYIQWSITQQSKRMKSCHLQLCGWNWRVLC